MKLHLGCGKVNIPGFINVDVSKLPHVDIVSDISSLPMFDSNSIKLIYVSATFQYFDREEGKKCLKEWHRILQKGGCLMISTVDFNKLLMVYKKTENLESIIGPLYGRMGVYDEHSLESGKIYHKTVYNNEELKKLLKESGFGNIEKYDFRQTIHNDYDDQSQSFYPHMDKEKGIHIMQNLRAYKQGGK